MYFYCTQSEILLCGIARFSRGNKNKLTTFQPQKWKKKIRTSSLKQNLVVLIKKKKSVDLVAFFFSYKPHTSRYHPGRTRLVVQWNNTGRWRCVSECALLALSYLLLDFVSKLTKTPNVCMTSRTYEQFGIIHVVGTQNFLKS